MPSKPFVVVDGSSYLFRAFHIPQLQEFKNDEGFPTGAIYGVINMMRRLMDEYSPSRIAVVFDAKGKTFRNDLYPEYKANRPPMPEELRAQIMPLHETLRAMGFPLLVVPGVEADDVIGTLARQATEHKLETIISTGDKDMAQLVNEHVSLVNTMNDTHMDVAGVEEKFGVGPELIIDYLALMGDKVDNVPGIPKVGPKTAAKWLNQYGSIEQIIEHADEVKGKVGESLRAHLQQLPLAKELVTIKCDVELESELDDLMLEAPNKDELRDKFKHFGFRTWYREVAGEESPAKAKPTAKYVTVNTQKELATWLKKLKSAKHFCLDTETTSLNYIEAELVGIALSVTEYEAAYIPLAHDESTEQLSRDETLAKIRSIIEEEPSRIVGQHFKYDMNVLANYGIRVPAVAHDTMLMSYVLNSVASRHDMDSLAQRYLDYKTISFEDVAGKGAKQKTFNEVAIDVATNYAAEDADITLRLFNTLHRKLRKTKKLYEVYEKIELPLVPVLAAMEQKGVLVDSDSLKTQSAELSIKMQELEQQAYSAAGEEFNMASPKQIQAILFEKLGLPIIKKTPKGQPSTAEDVLQELSVDYELPAIILQHRSMAKLKSTYTDKLPEQISARTGRIHTSYHQAVAATGRLSSTDPNLQNIPIRTEEGRRIRQAFIPAQGCTLVAADYSQIELRIMAHLSKDQGLLKAFNEGKDVHRSTAAEVFEVAEEEVTSDQRRNAKAINFGLIYGMSAFGLARQLGIERNAAQAYMDMYFERYPGVLEYMNSTREQAREQGYVETLFGRRLYLPDIKSSNHNRRQYAERTAINAPMQGTAADIIKLAMISCDEWIRSRSEDLSLIMQVHDELVFEVKSSAIESVTQNIRILMEKAAKLDVPLEVDVGTGKNWDEAH
jgi:DNA polymerase-1